jgi:ATP-dependent DNA ligase
MSRWNAKKDLSWEPLRAERVVEVEYDQLQGDRRFRRVARFIRWRPDKTPAECAYDQLEAVVPYEFLTIFTG